jgi:Fe2+ or Zn2+ uptake regulation protein
MLRITNKERVALKEFREALYVYLKAHELRYSDQRERVLKQLYLQSYPQSVAYLTDKISEEEAQEIGYATVARHVNFFKALGWLRTVNGRTRKYLLVKAPEEAMALTRS